MRLFLAILLVSIVNISPARAEVSPSPTIELVPAVRRGHSMTWTTGASITFTRIGVSLAGAALVIAGLGPNPDSGYGGNGDMFIAGLVISAVGDGGVFIGGPITWMCGIRGRDE